MSETSKDKDQEKGDEVLRRLLKTPPKPHEKTVKSESQQEKDVAKSAKTATEATGGADNGRGNTRDR